MCDFITPLIAAGAGGAAAAGGAAVAAGSGLNMLQTLGLIAGLGGTVANTVGTNRAISAQQTALAEQDRVQQQLNMIEDQRTRAEMGRQMAQQRAELVSRGIDLSSPTAVHLGVSAARELSFASQRVRSEGQARSVEIGAQQRMLRARRTASTIRGVTTVADTVLTAAPDIWPELLG